MRKNVISKLMNLPIVPGRGLNLKSAINSRQDFLKNQGLSIEHIMNSNLDLSEIENNIESYVGGVELPLGLVGPIGFKDGLKNEMVYTLVGTLEGALVASMNRGAKAIALSGGFSANVAWQKMVRAPLFLFEKEEEALCFESFVLSEKMAIAALVKKYSNHAELIGLEAFVRSTDVHLKLVYTTGDASGQNMTTTCTWHAMMYLVDAFKKKFNLSPHDFVIEGNGAADKKISQYNITNGRGINVTASCFLPEEVVEKVLRTSSMSMSRFYKPSKSLANEEGMVGYNINVANAIAGIFTSTGQDLACIHESATGFLELESVNGGLNVSLTLPNLVVGTIGGGTHLSKPSEVLKIMGCLGSGSVERFAKLIAGFALGLELSTYAAIVSGEFAKAHEKLGRNKPVKWLLKSELTSEFLSKFSTNSDPKIGLSFNVFEHDTVENGILTTIASRISKKLIGFVAIECTKRDTSGNQFKEKFLLKSKPLDQEIIKGLHLIASSINIELADLIKESASDMEYSGSHIKDIKLYQYLTKAKYPFIPGFHGSYVNTKREIYLFMQEYLEPSSLVIFNSENTPEIWGDKEISRVLKALFTFHQMTEDAVISGILEFDASESILLYQKLLSITLAESHYISDLDVLKGIAENMRNWSSIASGIRLKKCIVHNDFNPRNIAIRTNGQPVIYDLELAVIDFPTRDLVEFLSFVLPINFKKETLLQYLGYYCAEATELSSQSDWNKAICYSLETYIATRLTFYEVAGVVVKYEFSNRILNVAIRMLKILRNEQ